MTTLAPIKTPEPTPTPQPGFTGLLGSTGNTTAQATGQGLLGIQTAQVPTVAPVKAEVNPGETVEGITNRLLGEDSTYMQRARSLAEQKANERGLLNSSIAAGAGTAAAIDASLNIAQPDASIYSSKRIADAAADNEANRLNAANQLQASQFNAQQGNNFTLAQQDNALKQKQLDLSRFTEEQRVTLLELQNKYQTQLNNDSQFSDQYKSYVDAIFRIDSDPNLNAEAKVAAKNLQTEALRSYANIRNLGLDLSFLPAAPAAPAQTPAPQQRPLIRNGIFYDSNNNGSFGWDGG